MQHHRHEPWVRDVMLQVGVLLPEPAPADALHEWWKQPSSRRISEEKTVALRLQKATASGCLFSCGGPGGYVLEEGEGDITLTLLRFKVVQRYTTAHFVVCV